MQTLKDFFVSMYTGMVNCSSVLFGYDISIWDIFITSAVLGLIGLFIWHYINR